MDIEIGPVPRGLGAIRPLLLPATRYSQGGREMFHTVITLAQLPQFIVKRPDPSVPMEGNRKVDRRRALAFARYLRERSNWVSPAIIVRAPHGEIEFAALHEFEDGTAWGTLSIPLHLLTDVSVLDGQHRTLGIFEALDEMNALIVRAHESEESARLAGDMPMATMYSKQVRSLQEIRDRVAHEHISVDIAAVSSKEQREMFVDINNNAKGVNPDYTSYLDRRDIVNRIAGTLMESHELLRGRVESGQTVRMSPANPNLIGAKGVADIVRAVHVGATGRIGKRVEEEMRKSEAACVQRVERFLDTLCEAFPELQAVRDGAMTPVELREQSMLGSVTMLRVLASVYRELTQVGDIVQEPFTRSEVFKFFESLTDDLRDVPVLSSDGFWLQTGAFKLGGRAPQAMQGALVSLGQSLVNRAVADRSAATELKLP